MQLITASDMTENLTNGNERMLCWLLPFDACSRFLTDAPVLLAASMISRAKRNSMVFSPRMRE